MSPREKRLFVVLLSVLILCITGLLLLYRNHCVECEEAEAGVRMEGHNHVSHENSTHAAGGAIEQALEEWKIGGRETPGYSPSSRRRSSRYPIFGSLN